MEHPINSNNPFADNEMPLHMASYTHHHHQPRTKDFARNKKAPANVKRTHQHQWSSGRIHRCHRCDPGSIPG